MNSFFSFNYHSRGAAWYLLKRFVELLFKGQTHFRVNFDSERDFVGLMALNEAHEAWDAKQAADAADISIIHDVAFSEITECQKEG